jgi:hypothetical protein
LFASARAAGHAATLAESRKTSAFLNREADIHEFLRTNDDEPWERSFQFRPFAVDVFGAYGDGAIAILQRLARKRSEHTSMTAGACKRLAFQSLSVALQTANARMLRSRKAFVASFPPSTTRSSELMYGCVEKNRIKDYSFYGHTKTLDDDQASPNMDFFLESIHISVSFAFHISQICMNMEAIECRF